MASTREKGDESGVDAYRYERAYLSCFTMENNKNLFELLSDDEDDELLQHSSPIFAKKRRISTEDNATAAASPPKEVLTELGSCSFDIVGIRYYSGTAKIGDLLKLVREPQNVSRILRNLTSSFPHLYGILSLFWTSFCPTSLMIAMPFGSRPFKMERLGI